MGKPPHVVPESLSQHAFTTAQAAVAGVSPAQLTRGPYVRVSRGVWQAGQRDAVADHVRELRRLLPAMLQAQPGAAASHVTAAALLGLRVPNRLRMAWPIHLVSPDPKLLMRSPGIIAHRLLPRLTPLIEFEGVVVTSPARTAVDLAGAAQGRWPLLDDDALVAVLDGIICTHTTGIRKDLPALRSREQLERELRELPGVRGVARIKRALQRTAAAVDSALETEARLCLERFGETRWVTDLEVSAPNGSCFWPDLADDEDRLSLQAEGPHHARGDQLRKDILRRRLTEAAGWQELRVTAEDLRGHRPALIDMIRRARRPSPFAE